MPDLRLLPRDRIELVGVLLLTCFASVLLLSSQSAASVFTYLLALVVFTGYRAWSELLYTDLFLIVLVLLGYMTLTAFWSEDWAWRDVVSTLVRAVLVTAFVAAVSLVQLRGQVQRWLRRIMVLVGGGAVCAALVNYFVLAPPPDGRLNGLGQLDAHVIAALVYGFIAILALQALLREVYPLWRALAVITIVLSLVAIYLSDSRNAWVSVGLGLATLLLAERVAERDRFRSGIVMVGLLGAIFLVLLFINEGTRSLLLPRGTSFRTEIWELAIARILDGHLWVGLGILTDDNFLIGDTEILHPHNLYLSVMYQGGLLGLCLLGVLFWKVITELWRAYDDADAKLALGILGLALPAYMLDGHELLDKIGSTWFLIWLPVAIAVGLRWSRALQKV